jgi:NitT/TauT family transport system substrate-binding protein
MAQGNLDALWTTLDEMPAVRATMPEDVEVAQEALYTHLQVPGYPIFVNTPWYNETEDGVEYMSRILEGYSHALKWWMLNPEEMIDLMLNEINPSLQTAGREELLDLQRYNLANTVSVEAFNEGLGFISEDIADNMLNELGPHLIEDEADIPNTEDVLDLEPLNNADLATLTQDEQDQVIEFAGDAWALYE